MPISVDHNLNLIETEDENVFMLNNNFNTIYSYIYSICGETEEDITLYDLLYSLKAYWKDD